MALPASQFVQQPGLIHVTDSFTGSGQSQGINQYGQELENNEGRKPTYSAYVNAFTPQATPQDFLTLTGSPLVVARLLMIEIYYAATAAAAFEVGLYYNSAPDTGGTATTLSAVSHDPIDVAASCAVLAYTAAPTAGTHAGLIRAGRVVGGTTTGGGSGILPLLWTWTAINDKAFVLRNANQQIALNGFGAALPAGSVFEIGITWSEESLTGN
jgi:hypothetical protein